MDKMVLAVRTVLSKYATFSGRASRAEFWWWILAIFLLSLLTRLIDAFVFAPMLGFGASDENPGQPLSALVSLAILLPAIAVGARRLHDIGRSGWWLFLSLIPVLGTVILIYFYIQPSDDENQWGPPNPLY